MRVVVWRVEVIYIHLAAVWWGLRAKGMGDQTGSSINSIQDFLVLTKALHPLSWFDAMALITVPMLQLFPPRSYGSSPFPEGFPVGFVQSKKRGGPRSQHPRPPCQATCRRWNRLFCRIFRPVRRTCIFSNAVHTHISSSGNWSVDLQAGSSFGYRPMLFVILMAGLGAIVLQARSPLPTLLEPRNYFFI